MSANALRLVLPAVAIETLLIGIRLLANLQQNVVEAIALLLLTSTVYLVAVYGVTNPGVSPWKPTKVFVLGIALLFRVTVFPLFPQLSDDLYRYRWEAKLQALGGNPYQVRPKDEGWAALRDSTFPDVGLKDFKGIYGPALLLIERATYGVVRHVPDEFAQVFWFKAPAILAELGILGALLALLRVRGVPEERILIYAWSPVPLVEFWIGGHNDALVVLSIVLALVAAARNRWLLSFGALGLAIALKIWPAVLLPAFVWRARHSPRAWLSSAVVIPIFLIFVWPFWSQIVENAQFASGFIGGWQNNDSLFGGFLWLAGGNLYHAKYLTEGFIAASALVVAVQRWPLEKSVLVTIVIILFVSANCHPWYLTWFAPLLTLYPFPPILLWTALMPIAYSVLIPWKILGEWNGSTPIRWFIYGPVYILLVIYFCFRAFRPMKRVRQAAAGVR